MKKLKLFLLVLFLFATVGANTNSGPSGTYTEEDLDIPCSNFAGNCYVTNG